MKNLAFLLAVVLFSTLTPTTPAQVVTTADHDIGAVAAAGSASNNGPGAFTVRASGADIWGSADEFHFLYFNLNGDFELVTRVTGVQFTDGWAKAGLMARENLDASSRNVMVFAIPQNYAGFQWRGAAGGSSTYTPGGTFPFPSWLKLVRSGSTFSGYQSADGDNWTLISSVTLFLPNSLYVGLGVTSHRDGTICTATFDNFTYLSGGSGGGTPSAPTTLTVTAVSSNSVSLSWNDTSANETAFRLERSTDGSTFAVRVTLNANTTAFTDFGVSPGTHYWYRISATNNAGSSPPSNVAEATTTTSSGPPPYSGPIGQDIGAVAARGTNFSNQDLVSIWGSGADIWGTADEFRFFHFPASGDFEMVVSSQPMDNTNPWAKAGIMAREGLDANARNFMVFRTPSTDTGVQWRSAVGGNTAYAQGDWAGGSSLFWLKLVRIGNTFSGFWSADGGNWILIESATMALSSSLRVGLAVTSHNDGTLCGATFTDVEGPTGPGGNGGGGRFTPYPPTDLKATAISANSISLTWTDRASDETSYSVARSQDGINFTLLATLGANSTSYTDTGLSPSTHYWYAVSANNAVGSSSAATVDATTTAAGAPPGWFDRDIGTVSAAGSFSQSGDTFTVGGSGSDIWGNADELHYAYKYATGNVQVVARLVGMANTSPWAKAGIMIRASVDPGAQHAILALTPGNGLAFQWRGATGGPSSYTDAGPASAPVWVKLVRAGDVITGYRSADGVNWTTVGSVTIAMPSATVLPGLAVTSDNDGTVCVANFDNVSITTGTGSLGVPAAPSGLKATPLGSDQIELSWIDNASNETYFRVERSTDGVNFQPLNLHPPSGYTALYDAGLSPSTRYWYRIYAVNAAGDSPPSNVADATTPSAPTPSSWQHQDIGDVAAAGNFSQSGSTFSVTGSGYDIWDNSDEFHYAYQSGSGTLQIVVRITGMANTSPWAKAGVMIRQSLLRNAPNVLLALTPSHGLAFQWRSTAGGQTTYIDGGPASGPVWLKLVQTADTVTGYRSSDGSSWTQVASVTINVSSSMLAGLAVTSHNDGTACLANYDNVTITSGGGSGTTLVPAAPSGLVATATSSYNISLRWQDNASNESGFILERSTDGISFIQIGTFVANNQTAIEAVSPGTHHWYRVAATNSAGISPYSNIAEATSPGGSTGGGSLPAPWQSQNVGDVGVGGSASENQGTFTLKGSGADIWGTSDAFYFAYQTITGDGELTARVVGLSNTEPWAKAGIMFRQVLSANYMNVGNGKNVFVMATPEHGTGIQSRSATSGGSSYLPGPFYTAPVWLRLKRQGNVFTGYSSLDGANWTLIGSQTVTFDSPVVAGLAVTSHNNAVLNAATFDNVTWAPSP